MKVNLVENGVFPILKDLEGNNISVDTGYNIPGTVQGEGKLMGMPCIFVRLSACNLRCTWFNDKGEGSPCDTPYSSFKAEKNMWEIDDIVKLIEINNTNHNIKHIVISGGEPTLQTIQLAGLLKELQERNYHTTIETNGTIYNESISKYTNLFSFSPKLSNSTPTEDKFKGEEIARLGLEYSAKWENTHNAKRIRVDVLTKYMRDCFIEDSIYWKKKENKDFQLKFVVNNEEDLNEIKLIVNALQDVIPFPDSDVTLMPEGYFAEDVMNKSKWVINKCIENGYRFTTRLHTLIFGTSRGI